MKQTAPWFVAGLLAVIADAHAQQPPAQPVPAPTFRLSVDLVSSDVIVRDRRGEFQADLSKEEFELLEDGVKQDLNSFVLVHGGRVYTTQVEAPTPIREGIILPASRPVNDATGRILVFVIDDLHLEFKHTIRLRNLFKKMGQELVHEGDLFGIVSTGTSSIAIDLTYDRTRMDEAANRITGGGLKPSDIIEQASSGGTSAELLHRAHVAFKTTYEMLTNLEQTHNRRKAVVLISGGYDFDPFDAGRNSQSGDSGLGNQNGGMNGDNFGNRFSDAELAIELSDLARQANRANATFYTVDPRGLMAGQDIGENVNAADWETHLRKSQDSLRVLAELTGGIAVVNTNDFDKALKRIDAETSDYYVLGYYSSNPDPTQRRRKVKISLKRKDRDGGDLDVTYRREYTLKPMPALQKPK